jgi:Bacterial extracellular solute-binding proteins, family 5 Middle
LVLPNKYRISLKKNLVWLALGATLLPLLLITGCASSPTFDTAPSSPESTPILWPSDYGTTNQRQGCSPLPSESLPNASIIFALTDSVSPNQAPIPHNPSERLVFAQLYETLVNVDCEGNLKPGLASAWSCSEDSTQWVFTIRRGARFWDGTPVFSRDVQDSWLANQNCPQLGAQTPLWNWFNARSKTITLVDDVRIAIRLPEPQSRFPLLLAHPATAVSVRRDGWAWPVGSGPMRLRASTPAPLPDLECRPNPHHPQHPVWKNFTFRVVPDSDPRDLISTDIDLALTNSLDAVRFFQEMPGFHSTPLPWDRLFLLICPPEKNPAGTGLWSDLALRIDAKNDLTRVSARSWNNLVFPGGGAWDCPQLTGPISMNNISARREWDLGRPALDEKTIVFPLGNPAARELAQRLAALGPDDLRVAGVHPQSLNFILKWQMAGAMVLPSDQLFPTGCLQTATLLGRATWLQTAAFPTEGAENLVQAERQSNQHNQNPTQVLRDKGLVHPLALTHSWLITRGNWAGLELAFDGTPLLWNLGRPRQETVAP